MANCLIFFTPRTGSTILADLLAFKYNAWNLDEILAHQIRPQIIRRLPGNIAERIKQGKFNGRYALREQPPERFFHAMSEEISRSFAFAKYLMERNNVVIKCYTYPAALPHKAMQFAIKNNFEIYFLYRKNKEQQMHSIISASIREKHRKQIPGSGYVYTNLSEQSNLPEQPYDVGHMHQITYEMGNSFHTWYSLHQAYKQYGVTMCYEDTIAKDDFSLASISKELIADYRLQHEYLVPTKQKTSNIISNWDQLKPIINDYVITNE